MWPHRQETQTAHVHHRGQDHQEDRSWHGRPDPLELRTREDETTPYSTAYLSNVGHRAHPRGDASVAYLPSSSSAAMMATSGDNNNARFPSFPYGQHERPTRSYQDSRMTRNLGDARQGSHRSDVPVYGHHSRARTRREPWEYALSGRPTVNQVRRDFDDMHVNPHDECRLNSLRSLTANSTRFYNDEDNGESADSDNNTMTEIEKGTETEEPDEALREPAAKTSRYLREMDRRVILKRLENGEKQAALAKEYHVSRAAICNLYKHRHEVLSRTDENPMAKHPKKRKPTHKENPSASISGSSTASSASSSSLDQLTAMKTPVSLAMTNRNTPAVVQEIRMSALQLLLTKMRDSQTSVQEFRRATERALWLFMEEALAGVPVKSTPVTIDEGQVIDGITIEHPPCGISLERGPHALLDVFQLLEPTNPVGFVRPDELSAARSTGTSSLCVATLEDTHLPDSLSDHNVFLLDIVIASGETICGVIDCVLRRNAVESRVYVVALFLSSEVVAMVQCKYPRVRIMTAQIDSNITKRTQRMSAVDLVMHRFHQVFGPQQQ